MPANNDGAPVLYLTKTEGERFEFPYDYRQTFHHEFRLSRTPREAVLVKDFCKFDDERQKIEKEALYFLRDFCFATESQLKMLLGAKGLNPDILPPILESCVTNHVINFFCLSQFVMDKVPDDALKIYCLDHGARHILTHFSKQDELTWISSDNIRSSELVAKYLMTGNFYLQVMAVKGESVKWFKPLADYTIGHRMIRVSGVFQIMQGFTPRNFILEVIRHDDLPIVWQQKVNEKLAPFIRSYWSQYYKTLPVFLLLTQNDEDALSAAEIFHMRIGDSAGFRVLTDKHLMEGLDKAPFYAYVPESDTNPTPGLKKVRAKIFMPD